MAIKLPPSRLTDDVLHFRPSFSSFTRLFSPCWSHTSFPGFGLPRESDSRAREAFLDVFWQTLVLPFCSWTLAVICTLWTLHVYLRGGVSWLYTLTTRHRASPESSWLASMLWTGFSSSRKEFCNHHAIWPIPWFWLPPSDRFILFFRPNDGLLHSHWHLFGPLCKSSSEQLPNKFRFNTWNRLQAFNLLDLSWNNVGIDHSFPSNCLSMNELWASENQGLCLKMAVIPKWLMRNSCDDSQINPAELHWIHSLIVLSVHCCGVQGAKRWKVLFLCPGFFNIW